MAGVTKEEIARAKELDLLTYFKLVEPGNLKLVGKEYRHKLHSSLTISKGSLWCWHCIGLRGRTALKYLIDVEKVPYVEAVREINRIQGGVVHSSQPVSLPQPRAEPEVPRTFTLPEPDTNSYSAMAYLRRRCIHPNVLAFCRKEGILYQTSFKNHPNCVFVGRDGEGVAKGGSLRGCTQLQFRRDIPGSKKIYPFYIQASTKANACVERVFTIWKRTKAQRSTQMIFCDLSTPRADGFDVYNDIRDKLVARGIPKDEVQFIHDADTEAKKAELFGKVRSGAVRVLMGSTQKMGAGTNVQTRLCALHHLDCPWRPADIAQRNGRMVRQGNMNKEVSIFIYITEATFDAYSYQLVENKQKFISQIMTSKSPARSCEDLDEAALSYAEVKALAAGNPMIKEKMDLDIQVARLRTLKAAYNSQHYRLEDAVTGIFLREIRGTECRIQAFEKDMQTAKDSQSYDKDGKLVFSIELDGTSYDKREDAGKALLGLVGAAVRANHPVLVGHYAGFEVTVAYVPLSKVFVVHLVGQATHTTELGSDAAGNMVRLQNVVAALPQEVSGLRNNLQQLRVQLDSAKEELQQPFLQEQELNDKSARLAELDALLNVGNDAPVLEGEAEVVNEDDSVRTPREENELER